MTGPVHDWERRPVVRKEVRVEGDRVIKHFPAAVRHHLDREVAAYQALPWAAPKLLWHTDSEICVERCTPITDLPPDPADAVALRRLLGRVHEAGWVHGDVSLINVVKHPTRGPLLIDWETAGPADTSQPSYDLFGAEASGCPQVRIPPHQRSHGVWWGGPSQRSPLAWWGLKRIVALVHFYPPYYMAGSETMLHTMLRALADRGHDVQVVVTSHERGPAHYVHDGIRVQRAGRRGGVVQMLDELSPDVIVSHHQEAPNACHYAKRRNGTRSAVLFHNTFPGAVGVAHQWQPDLMVFNTEWVKSFYEQQHVAGARNGLVMHPPIRGEEHRTRSGRHVTLVNLNEDKGANVFYALAERMPDVSFLGVIGGHGEQIIRTDLPNVRIQEHTPDPRRDVWAHTRILLMPSIYESYGMVSIEAAHSGIPTIATPTPGLKEALAESGTFVERGDLDGWEREISRLLGQDEWRLASKHARARAEALDPRKELAAWVGAVESL